MPETPLDTKFIVYLGAGSCLTYCAGMYPLRIPDERIGAPEARQVKGTSNGGILYSESVLQRDNGSKYQSLDLRHP